jgi:hypothetical protein
MPARRKIPEDIRNQVRQRANYLCDRIRQDNPPNK